MGGKHLKKLRAEKSKVHLKKKRLIKGQNLTNTAFTVKKILPLVQLQRVDKDVPVSNWNVPLKDLLTRLNHYNFTSRLNSLYGIKELITKYPDILNGPSLKPLICKLLELITDEERKIRETTVNVISYLCDLISPSSIVAFQKIILLHLGCAMTHRNACIQQDSLSLVDVMLKYFPQAIRCNFKLLIQNFLRIMKSFFYESYAGVFSSGKSKQDLEKAKLEMLFRFYQFIVKGFQRVTEQKQYCASSIAGILKRKNLSLRSSNDQYKKIPDLSVFENSGSKEKLSGDFNSEDFKGLCSLVIPLLFDTWVEFCPYERYKEVPEYALTEVTGDLLLIILKILLFLYERAATYQDMDLESWFVSNFGPGFKKSFTFSFPYKPRDHTNILKCNNPRDFQKDISAYMLPNLIICYLAYSLKAMDQNNKLENKIENYVAAALMSNQQDIDVLLRVINAATFSSKNGNSNLPFSKVIATYNVTPSPELRKGLTKILLHAALEENKNIEVQDFTSWMKSLVDRLCQVQVFVEEVEAILKLVATPSGMVALREIELKAEEILKNLQDIKIEGVNQLEGQKMIANILYRCSQEVLMVLLKKKIFDKIMYHQDLKTYIFDIFSQRLVTCLGSCET